MAILVSADSWPPTRTALLSLLGCGPGERRRGVATPPLKIPLWGSLVTFWERENVENVAKGTHNLASIEGISA